MNSRTERGFTLVEVLIAVVLLAIGLLSVTLAFSNGIMYTQKMREISVATQAAQAKMEEVRNDTFPPSSSTFTPPTGLKSATGTVTVDDPYSSTDMRRVTVTVSWTSYRGQAERRSLVTLVTREGINKK